MLILVMSIEYLTTFLSKSKVREFNLLKCQVLTIVKSTANSSLSLKLLYGLFSNPTVLKVSLEIMYF